MKDVKVKDLILIENLFKAYLAFEEDYEEYISVEEMEPFYVEPQEYKEILFLMMNEQEEDETNSSEE